MFDGSAADSVLTKSQIENLMSTYVNPSDYLQMSNYLTESDINNIIANCV